MIARTPSTVSASGSAEHMCLAIFGKHPLAADHLDDIGLSNPALVEFKRQFYTEGLGTCIERGVWSRELAGNAAPPYDHYLLTAAASGWILARFVASEDAAGRAQYPLTVCLQGTELETLLAIDALRVNLDQSIDAARSAASLGQLRAMSSTAPSLTTATRMDLASAKAAWIGSAQPGLDRFVHALSPEGSGARCVRVPLSDSAAAREAVLWCSFLSHMQPVSAVTIVWRGGAPFADLAGTPPRDLLLRPLFASECDVALVTNVPFQVTPHTRESAAALRTAWTASRHLFPQPATASPDPGFFEKLRRDFGGWWRS